MVVVLELFFFKFTLKRLLKSSFTRTTTWVMFFSLTTSISFFFCKSPLPDPLSTYPFSCGCPSCTWAPTCATLSACLLARETKIPIVGGGRMSAVITPTAASARMRSMCLRGGCECGFVFWRVFVNCLANDWILIFVVVVVVFLFYFYFMNIVFFSCAFLC